MSERAEELAKFINKAGFPACAYDIGAVGVTIEDYAAKYDPDCKLSYEQYAMRLMINGTEDYIII